MPDIDFIRTDIEQRAVRFSAYVVRSGGYTIPEYPAALPTRRSTGYSKVGPKKKAGKKEEVSQEIRKESA
jgi:hypothetical protein